ncbi:prepilin-type N-terminal cleavage/methylation domain-containing protein [Gracilibacillus halotolerans]|uniref:Prepilin-type N-terminal cleavage/methylation domain-containing protein n=1 Tax=Gracilibacillus halotolerans TaxID=74386 RepID=A0A841RM03_9BACI|nr:prepilin-type N-terminal cleavage/methylation domain-containing protein [Gracilibacillus halotolerans]MBB6511964.1 prepilin-type N-terminal cleavage/methylation domain-containing protein [Gracilibacillus halotolerans]
MVCEKSNMDKQKGFTLVEVLASIVLISLIVMVSISFFIHSQQTQNTSAQITDATYVVQSEMENILNLSKAETLNIAVEQLRDDPEYQDQSNSNMYKFKKIETPYYLELRVIKDEDKNNKDVDMYKIIIEAYENSKLKAKMETKIEWEDGR